MDQGRFFGSRQGGFFSNGEGAAGQLNLGWLARFGQIFEPPTAEGSVVGCIDEGHVRPVGALLFNHQVEAIEAFLGRSASAGFVTHADCAALASQARVDLGLPVGGAIDLTALDAYCVEKGRELAGRLRVPYLGHDSLEVMARPVGQHLAHCVWYVGVDHFNPYLDGAGLPLGFTVFRRYHDREAALAEVEVAISVALSEHGFGGFFSQEHPFYLIAVGERGGQRFAADNLQQELTKLDLRQGRVKVAGFDWRRPR